MSHQRAWLKLLISSSMLFFFFFCPPSTGDATVPVADCSKVQYYAQPKREMEFSKYLEYWKDHIRQDHKSKEGCLYLKDWHFVQWVALQVHAKQENSGGGIILFRMGCLKFTKTWPQENFNPPSISATKILQPPPPPIHLTPKVAIIWSSNIVWLPNVAVQKSYAPMPVLLPLKYFD